MIRVGFFSSDSKLHLILCSALGVEFKVLLENTELGIMAMLEDGVCDVVLMDLDSASPNLHQHLPACRRLASMPSVVMADDALRSTSAELVKLGSYGACRKPPSVRDLKIMLRRAYETSLSRKHPLVPEQAPAEPAGFQGIIGTSLQMQEVYGLIRRVSDLNASVLITGESGTGKELIARAIHNHGSRAAEPFVAVSCGAIPETLIEAELFGHEKGAFTGSVGAREGYLEQAAGGTLLLDEIGEISPATQVKLLRVLQQREFSRLGSSRTIPLRARVLFATHADLPTLVAAGRFRLDLFYRINVVRVDIPSLQERRDDIPLIANHFLRLYTELFQKPVDSIEPEAMAALQSYSWPGNVRELENVIQRAVILTSSLKIQLRDLPVETYSSDIVNIEDYRTADSFESKLREYKLRLAESAVREHNGNKTLAARSLKISRAYLHRLLRLADQDVPDTESLGMEMA